MSSKGVTKLFIANLSWTVGTRELLNYFREFGRVANATVVVDKNTGISKGYGFVTYFGKDSLEKINNQKSHHLEGWPLIIETVTGGSKSQNETKL